ncbi:FtsH protease activity modulator HflK [Amphritea sp. 1_MG-2023]|uniref:FtsH protease activity modulator HflK n=1 Tax=Amphritea sp. 1_MG-2023 TaxID=3062670 RepID=UPI0026E2221E|nr:FtsH protease activity modulator HflK [Amphritea sp. 1_MG-2023]MDO6564852.1 FtsH protease activity modulator HflK [Amphritea sp. 1_MG-2023]
MAWNEPGGNGNNQDPWNNGGDRRGGGKKDQGPPDLDEALQKLQEKLNGIFGKGGGNKGTGGAGSSGSSAGFFAVVVVVILVGWAVMGFYTVDQQERGVVLRLGKYQETVMPGLQWNPPMIDEVITTNVTRVSAYEHRSLMLTEDENIVDVSMTVQYVISDPVNYALKVRDPNASLQNASESALRHTVGSSEMNSILTAGREVLGSEVKQRLQSFMDAYQTGLRITQINIKEAKAPSQVQDAFDDVIKAREDEQRSINQSESYRNGIVPEARGIAQRMKEEANGYRERVVAQAQGDAQRFSSLLAEYQKAPEVTRERLYLDAMEEVLSNNSKVLIDVEGGNNMMYLPLDKLVESRPRSSTGTSSGRLNSSELQDVTDRVIDQLRQRQQTTTREAR